MAQGLWEPDVHLEAQAVPMDRGVRASVGREWPVLLAAGNRDLSEPWARHATLGLGFSIQERVVGHLPSVRDWGCLQPLHIDFGTLLGNTSQSLCDELVLLQDGHLHKVTRRARPKVI